jgi:hypothetical protein
MLRLVALVRIDVSEELSASENAILHNRRRENFKSVTGKIFLEYEAPKL